MPIGVFKRSAAHNLAISKAKLGHKTSIETKKKIGDANRRPRYFNCDYCGKESFTKVSAYKRKKRHFCSQSCYSKFRAELLPIEEQFAWKGGIPKQEVHRRYVRSHPEVIAHLKARRYAREKNAEGNHSLQEWRDLKLKFNNCCATCKEEKPLTKDHITPLSLGGTDYIANIQPLCRNCNSKKWKKVLPIVNEVTENEILQ